MRASPERIGTGREPASTSLWERQGSTYDLYPDLFTLETPAAVAPTAPHTYRVYRARWHMLAIFCLSTMLNAFMWITFSPIVSLTRKYYNISLTQVNLLSVVFMLLYAPGSYLSMWLLQRWGLRRSIVTGTLLNVVGSWIRYCSVFLGSGRGGWGSYGYWVLFVGQMLPALAQPMFTNVPAKLAGEWFPHSERDVATVIAALFNPLGNAAGQVVPTLLVLCSFSGVATARISNNSSFTPTITTTTTISMPFSAGLGMSPAPAPSSNGSDICPSAHDVHGIDLLLLLQAGLVSAASLWALIFFRREPPTPPSKSAAARAAARRQYEASPPSMRLSATSTISNHLHSLLANREFIKVLIGFGSGLALFNALLTVLEQLVEPLYWSHGAVDLNAATGDAGLYGGVLIGAGLLGAGITGPILDCTHLYREFLKGGMLLACGAITFVLWQLQPNNQVIITIGMGVLGLCIMPLLPIALESAVECTYPIPEEVSATLLMLVGNLIGLGFTFLMQFLIGLAPVYDGNPWTPAAIALMSTVVFSLLVILTFNGKYLRLAADKDHQDAASAALLQADIDNVVALEPGRQAH